MNNQNVPLPNIRTLFNREAKRRDIIEAFRSLFLRNAEIREDDVRVFFFAGHSHIGALTTSQRDDDQARTICPVDAQVVPSGFISSLGICRIQCMPLNDLVTCLSPETKNRTVRNSKLPEMS